jgi:hypothetical protein
MTRQVSRLIGTVDEMLLDAGQEQDTGLRAALLSLGSLASLPAPPPTAQLAALLACRPDDLSWRRRLRRHRPVIVGLAVVAGMGLGVTGVAASASRPAEQASASIQELLEDWAPPWNVSGLPAAAPATGPLREPADGKQESPVRDTAKQPDLRAAEAGSHDAGPGARDAAGSAGGAKKPEAMEQEDRGPAASDQAAGDSAGNGPKAAAEPGTVPDGVPEAARQALEKSAKLLAGVVPPNTVSPSTVPPNTVPANPVPANSMPANAAPRESGNRSAGKAGTGKKTDPGAKWLKKFNH